MRLIEKKTHAGYEVSLCKSGMNSPYYVVTKSPLGESGRVRVDSLERGKVLLHRRIIILQKQFPDGR